MTSKQYHCGVTFLMSCGPGSEPPRPRHRALAGSIMKTKTPSKRPAFRPLRFRLKRHAGMTTRCSCRPDPVVAPCAHPLDLGVCPRSRPPADRLVPAGPGGARPARSTGGRPARLAVAGKPAVSLLRPTGSRRIGELQGEDDRDADHVAELLEGVSDLRQGTPTEGQRLSSPFTASTRPGHLGRVRSSIAIPFVGGS